MPAKVSKKPQKTAEVAKPVKKAAAKKPAAKTAGAVKTVKSAKAPVVKKTAVKAAKKSGAANGKISVDSYAGTYIVLDHPVHNETIFGNHYAIRIGASQDGFVEISFNKGEWQPCRYAAGYWWFDWEYFMPGNYTIAVRLVDQGGETISQSDHRPCTVC
ncbi:MAG: hypothetical protein FWC85_04395 [Elusimicrobia bacterium]|nr:hypothetical protein [Elusimicrobiota bacterium]